jgi:phosphoribosylformimino-5-aminoimidazole carboxamide ribotide isomerase
VQIIPVIDLLDGQVVRAIAGNRAAYRPIESRLAPSSDPLAIANALLDLAPFPILYVADLDAITDHGSERNRPVLMRLCGELVRRGASQLWLDAGGARWVDGLIREATAIDLRVVPVSGSESLGAYDATTPEGVLSLDYRDGRFLGPPGLDDNAGAWPGTLIVMDLAAVGVGGGPALERIDELMARARRAGRTDIAFHAAGGIRNEADLEALAERNVHGVLIASALHDGSLDAAAIDRHLS